jgi:hypothetical protein
MRYAGRVSETGPNARLATGPVSHRASAEGRRVAAAPHGRAPHDTGHRELSELGVDAATYRTPCLFAAHRAIDAALAGLKAAAGQLAPVGDQGVGVAASTALLEQNLTRLRDHGGAPTARNTVLS